MEIDLIEDRNHTGFALTAVERKSQFALVVRADNKQADIIQTKIINALAPYKKLVHTITSSNGKEFTNHQFIAQKLPTDYVFCRPLQFLANTGFQLLGKQNMLSI